MKEKETNSKASEDPFITPRQQTLPGIDVPRDDGVTRDDVREMIRKAMQRIKETSTKVNEKLIPRIERHEYPDYTIDVIGLTEECAEEVAKEAFDKVIGSGENLTAIIIDLSKRKTKEEKYIKGMAEKLGIGIAEVIVSPYSRVVAEEAGVSEDEAAMAIMRAKESIYSRKADTAIKVDMAIDVINKNFGRKEGEIRKLYFSNFNDSRKSNKRKENETFKKLLDTSKAMSRRELEKQKFKGRVLAVVCLSHIEIFSPDFQPDNPTSAMGGEPENL